MNEIWTIVEPYILTILGALGGGSIIAVIARMICKRLIDKASAAYNLNEFAAKVADKLGGKTIDVDITAIAETRLQEIADKLNAEIGEIADETNSYKHLLALIGGALTHLKMLTDDERVELTKAVNELDAQFVPPKKEVMATVKLQPVSLDMPTVDNSIDTANTPNLV